jgi:hypothetical protein
MKYITKVIDFCVAYQQVFWGALFGAITALALN